MSEKNDYMIQRENNRLKTETLIRCTEQHALYVAQKISADYDTRCDIFRIMGYEHIGMVRPEAKR